MSNTPIQDWLKSLSSEDLRKAATLIFYDTPVSSFDGETDEQVFSSCLENIIPQEDDDVERIWTREGKTGDALTLEQLKKWFDRENEGEWTYPEWITNPDEYYGRNK